jgi:hypothetical protein
MDEWRLNIDEWPGPDRKKWPGLRDVIAESPDGRRVAVVYSCGEIGIGKEVGSFAILQEPKLSPRLELRPRGLTCFVWYGEGTTVQWIGNRFCVVTPYCVRTELSGKTQSFSGVMYFDVEEHKVAYVPGALAGKIITQIPDELVWRSWNIFTWRPRFWQKK